MLIKIVKILALFIPFYITINLIINDAGDLIGTSLLIWIFCALLLIECVYGRLKLFRLPPTSFHFLIFLSLFAISFIWSKNVQESFVQFSFYIFGYIFWFVGYNLKNKLKKFDVLVIILGVIFGLLAILNLFGNRINDVNSLSLIKYAVAPLHHHHIGDYWAVILIILALKFVSSKKRALLFIIFFGLYLLMLSLSRSAYVALALGSMFCMFKLKNFRIPIFVFLMIISLALFLYAGTKKSTISAHQGYLVQGIIGTLRNPLGIGVGNFKYLSKDPQNNLAGITGGSSAAHNIVLEMFAGMGFLGISFLVWLIKTLKSLIRSRLEQKLIHQAAFITLTVNFMFDYTYQIPTLLWLWFAFLGLSQSKENRKNKNADVEYF